MSLRPCAMEKTVVHPLNGMVYPMAARQVQYRRSNVTMLHVLVLLFIIPHSRADQGQRAMVITFTAGQFHLLQAATIPPCILAQPTAMIDFVKRSA